MWRYAEMLPLVSNENRVSLGEGMTPMIPLDRIGNKYGYSNLWLKDEGQNPTGSFKARGLSVAISKTVELGVTHCVIPTAGNAGEAMSAYCARANIRATVVMPKTVPKVFKEECEQYGAELIIVDGLMDECSTQAQKISNRTGAFNLATMTEPYRLEGKKTMGYEIAEQMNWELPDLILYPTGGGTGLIGIWKAFHEMYKLGWLSEKEFPRMIAVQSSNCAPLVNWDHVWDHGYEDSIANGLVVPFPFARTMIHKVLRESRGYAISVTEDQIIDSMEEMSRTEGIPVCPEGASLWAALNDLDRNTDICRHEKILLLNTASGIKYGEALRNYRSESHNSLTHSM